MRMLKVSVTLDIEDYVPIRVEAEGSSIKDLIDNAEYCVDCPNPKRYNQIDNLSSRTYDRVVHLLEDAWNARKSGAQ